MKTEEGIENKLKELAEQKPKDVSNPKVLDGFIAGLRWALKPEDTNCVTNEICECGHHTDDHSYIPEELENDDLDCDKCECRKFIKQEKAE